MKTCLENLHIDMEHISEVGEIRADRQWARVWCDLHERYEEHWLLVCEQCGSARCHSAN
jgi:hypothetical protein